MWGELAGVALVSITAVAGVATIMLRYPTLFIMLKYVGGGYLLFLGVQLFRSKGKMAISAESGSHGKQSAPESLPVRVLLTAVVQSQGLGFYGFVIATIH